jgi:type II secretory pathway pseudopilin PulG
MSDDLPAASSGPEQPACPGCGAPTHAGAAFCHKCGHPLGAGAPPPLASGPATTPAPSVFDAPPAAVPTLPPPFGQPPPAAPPRGTTLPGWGAPAQPQPAAGPAQSQSTWPYAAPTGPRGPSPYAPAPAPRSSTAVIILAVLGGGLVLLAILGILAAIAIPNFMRYQLRTKASEVPVILAGLDRAEVARKGAGESYVVFSDGLPAGQAVGSQKLRWSKDDAEQAAAFDWLPGEATYGRYAVDGQEDDDGNQAISMCGEIDLDGDGALAAWVVFRPALAPDGSMIVPPPPAPCSPGVALREGVSLEFDAARPPGTVVRVSPDNVF